MMIHLDTNLLIAASGPESPLKERMRAWMRDGEKLSASSIAWAEFLQGPVTFEQIDICINVVEGRVLAFGKVDAQKAAELFNQSGRRRSSRFDCFIAASAICAGASLATENRRDFLPYVAAGLRLL
jgi:predicted nucleic acid-binding protein